MTLQLVQPSTKIPKKPDPKMIEWLHSQPTYLNYTVGVPSTRKPS